MTQPQGALLVGSINLPDAEHTFRAAAETLGAHLRRLPDGEPGERFHWIVFQPDVLGRAAGIERVGEEPVRIRTSDVRPLRIAEGVDPATIELPPLGYAAAARDSYARFVRLRAEGVIPKHLRFQVSLPTPLSVIQSFVVPESRAAFTPLYTAAIFRELAEILAEIPHHDLAIQWDCALEFALIERAGVGASAVETVEERAALWDDLIARGAEQAARVPEAVELGYHLCYGDVAEKHFVEPTDTANLVAFANRLAAAAPRSLTWVHLPVPIERDDDAYFAPLGELALAPETELFLGLVHREDGAAGAERRIATALRHVSAFGVATECGIGRAPDGVTVPLFEAHAAVATPVV